jgi:hypothetical protein
MIPAAIRFQISMVSRKQVHAIPSELIFAVF